MRRVFWCLQIDTGPRRSPSACTEILKKTPLGPVDWLPSTGWQSELLSAKAEPGSSKAGKKKRKLERSDSEDTRTAAAMGTFISETQSLHQMLLERLRDGLGDRADDMADITGIAAKPSADRPPFLKKKRDLGACPTTKRRSGSAADFLKKKERRTAASRRGTLSDAALSGPVAAPRVLAVGMHREPRWTPLGPLLPLAEACKPGGLVDTVCAASLTKAAAMKRGRLSLDEPGSFFLSISRSMPTANAEDACRSEGA